MLRLGSATFLSRIFIFGGKSSSLRLDQFFYMKNMSLYCSTSYVAKYILVYGGIFLRGISKIKEGSFPHLLKTLGEKKQTLRPDHLAK